MFFEPSDPHLRNKYQPQKSRGPREAEKAFAEFLNEVVITTAIVAWTILKSLLTIYCPQICTILIGPKHSVRKLSV